MATGNLKQKSIFGDLDLDQLYEENRRLSLYKGVNTECVGKEMLSTYSSSI